MSGSLPYRENVGAALFNAHGRVFVGRRRDRAPDAPAAWQMPQGGIDPGEAPEAAVLRELEEETGTRNAAILARHPDLHVYDLPPELLGKIWGGRFRGQQQHWFALRFLGDDREIVLDRHKPPEFDAWRWAALDELPRLAVPFKKPIYEILARDFAPFVTPGVVQDEPPAPLRR